MRNVLFTSLAIALAGIASAMAAAADRPQVLFLQSAKTMSFKDGVLTLHDPAPMTSFFSDRPQRLTGQVRNDLFAKLWSQGADSFKSDAPNAALSVYNPAGRPIQVVLVLKNPRIDGANLSYDAQVLKGAVPAAGTESTLFIDGGSTPCDSDIDDPSYSSYPCWAQNAFSQGER
jgi:hypothetical protein